MKTVFCGKCGFSMVVRKIVPKACPLCGYDKTQEDVDSTKLKVTYKPGPLLPGEKEISVEEMR